MYWTKIGVAEIWNTTKWSSMRSSFYRTIQRLSRGSIGKFTSERPFSSASIHSDEIENVSLEQKKTNPKRTSYITPPNSTARNPVSIISPSDNPGQKNYATKIDNINEYDGYNDLASTIQKQRF
jgi:hypothetical protein